MALVPLLSLDKLVLEYEALLSIRYAARLFSHPSKVRALGLSSPWLVDLPRLFAAQRHDLCSMCIWKERETSIIRR